MKRYKTMFLTITLAIALSFLCVAIGDVLAQEVVGTPTMVKKTIGLSWRVDVAEEDVNSYQVFISRGEPNDLEEFGERIPIDRANATMSTQAVIEIPSEQDSEVWLTVMAIDNNGNRSHLAKPWIGVRYMNEPPSDPVGLKAIEIE